MNTTTHPYFVPDNTMGSRRDTAVLLVGTATEEGIDQREVFAVPGGGFRISEAVYSALGWDETEDNDEVGGSDARIAPGAQVPAEPPVGQSAEDVTDAIDAEVPAYADWEYADLRTEVSRRDIETPDLKTATLIAALEAYDASVEDDEDADAEAVDNA